MQTLQLPIELDALPPETRSWIITKSAAEGIDPSRLAHDVIVRAAELDGFSAKPASPVSSPKDSQTQPEGGLR